MIQELDADIDPNVLPVEDNGTKTTQNTEKNKLLKNLWKGDKEWETYSQLLDYIFISKNSKNGKQISVDATSFCEILIPQVPKGCNNAECMVSDHFPNTCNFYTNGAGDNIDLPTNPPTSFPQQNGLPSGAPCGESHHSDSSCASGECSYYFNWSKQGWYCEQTALTFEKKNITKNEVVIQICNNYKDEGI